MANLNAQLLPMPDLEARVNELVELGRSWGMDESDIQECLDVAGRDEEDSTSVDHRGIVSTIVHLVWNSVKFVVKSVLIFIVAIALLYSAIVICSTISSDVEHVIGKMASPMIYPAMRFARILFKPLTDKFDIAGFYNADCMVNNPFFLDPVDDCGPCVHRTKFVDMTGKSVKKIRWRVEEITPFILKGYMKTPVDFVQLQQMFFENENRFKAGGLSMFHSNLDNVYNVSDFFYKYNHEDIVNTRKGVGYMVWDSNTVTSSQGIRKLFPRPHFVAESSEVSLLKRVIIEGPLAGRHELAVGGFANVWYQQAYGSRRLTLTPHPHCRTECKAIPILLHAGDLIFFQDQFWRLISDPAIGEDGSVPESISIGFTGSFTA